MSGASSVYSLSTAIDVVDDEISMVENIKPRGMNHQCKLDDRLISLENLKEFLRKLQAEGDL